MADPVDSKAFLNLCEMSIDNMYELEALGILLEQKGLLTKQEILTLAKDLKQKTSPIEPTDPSKQRFTAQENAVIEQIMEVIQAPWPLCRPRQDALRPDHPIVGIGQADSAQNA